MSDPACFASPQEAVEAINRFLSAKDWPALSRYYDLSGTDVAPGDLESGAFFAAPGPPDHPAWGSRFRRPFPPGFRYQSHEMEGDDALVVVAVAIDQGGGMIQRAFQRFRLRKSALGWRVRPEPVA